MGKDRTLYLTGLIAPADIKASESICVGCCWESAGELGYFCRCRKMDVNVSISRCLGKNKGQTRFGFMFDRVLQTL